MQIVCISRHTHTHTCTCKHWNALIGGHAPLSDDVAASLRLSAPLAIYLHNLRCHRHCPFETQAATSSRQTKNAVHNLLFPIGANLYKTLRLGDVSFTFIKLRNGKTKRIWWYFAKQSLTLVQKSKSFILIATGCYYVPIWLNKMNSVATRILFYWPKMLIKPILN